MMLVESHFTPSPTKPAVVNPKHLDQHQYNSIFDRKVVDLLAELVVINRSVHKRIWNLKVQQLWRRYHAWADYHLDTTGDAFDAKAATHALLSMTAPVEIRYLSFDQNLGNKLSTLAHRIVQSDSLSSKEETSRFFHLIVHRLKLAGFGKSGGNS